MARDPTITRRLLLGHGVGATFLIPELAAAAAAHRSRPRPRPHGDAHPRIPPLVMLDPGHGGKDPGAIGVSGTYEKHIAFAAAHELRRQLEAGRRYRVLLTRESDHFIPLQERVAIAQKHGAALFVSMHADALPDHSVRGASVYTLSGRASDAQSEALARRENAADRFGQPGYQGLPPEVAQILGSLVRQETRMGAARMQAALVRSLGQNVRLLEHPARHAAFAVLKSADIPSVLVEMGFMSNPADEAALRRPDHRARVALAMAKAVDGWFASQGHFARIADGAENI